MRRQAQKNARTVDELTDGITRAGGAAGKHVSAVSAMLGSGNDVEGRASRITEGLKDARGLLAKVVELTVEGERASIHFAEDLERLHGDLDRLNETGGRSGDDAKEQGGNGSS